MSGKSVRVADEVLVMRLSSVMQAGLERIIVNGRVRFMFRPLLGELPIIGGLQVSLFTIQTTRSHSNWLK